MRDESRKRNPPPKGRIAVNSAREQPEEEMHDLGRPDLGRRIINHVRFLEKLGYIMSEPVLGVAARAVWFLVYDKRRFSDI